jgi:DNA invertase Pin-like site-specific DNA recombinase
VQYYFHGQIRKSYHVKKTVHDDNSDGHLVGYARVSTLDQNLDMQIEDMVQYGVPRDRIWAEKKSAGKRRVKLEQCLKYLEPGDTLVVWKLDRLGRSVRDLMNKMHELEQRGIHLVSIKDKLDTSSAIGRLMNIVLAALAEFERDLIAERTSAGMQRKLATGWRPGPKPKFTPAMVKEAQTMRNKGMTAAEIIETLREKHKVKLSPRIIYLRTKR